MRNVKIALEILGKANFEDVWSEISKNREKNVLLEKENKKLTQKNDKWLDLICSYQNVNETMFQEREIDRIEIELLKEEKKIS